MGNIYGPGDQNFSRIIPGTIRNILKNKPPEIRSDGSPIREYLYVDDAVNAYLTLAEKSTSIQRPGEAFNFSSGEQRSVRKLVDQILQLMGSDLQPVILNTSKHEIQNQYLSIKKAATLLGWHPKYALNSGLPLTINWYKEILQ
jgi:CDP-glucose 4,6-dehydratase